MTIDRIVVYKSKKIKQETMPITAEFVNLSLNEMVAPFEEKVSILTFR